MKWLRIKFAREIHDRISGDQIVARHQTGSSWKIFKCARHRRIVATDTVAITNITDSKIVCSHPHRAPALRAARRERHKAVVCKGCELFRLAQSALRQGNHRARISFAWQGVRRVAELTEPRPDLDKASSMRQFQHQRRHPPRPWQYSRPLQ